MRIFVLLAMLLAAVGVASPAMAASQSSGAATRIVLDRSGGFAGVRETFVVDRSTADGTRVLRLAGTARFRHLRSSYQPANPCCDRFAYQLTATYRGGTTKSVSTVDGARAPQVLWDVIGMVQKVGTHSDPAPRT